MLAKWLMPNAAGLLLFVLFLAGHVMAGTVAAAGLLLGGDQVFILCFGYPVEGFIYVRGANQLERHLEINWVWLIGIIISTYVVAMMLGRLVSGGWGQPEDGHRRTGWRRPEMVLLTWTTIVVTAAFGAAMITSRLYWGYYLWPRGVHELVYKAEKVRSVTAIETELGSPHVFVHSQRATDWKRVAELAHTDSDSRRFTRPIAVLVERGLLAPEPEVMSAERLAPLHALLDSTKRLDPGDPSWVNRPGSTVNRDPKRLSGYIVEFEGPKRQPLMLICTGGGEVSNDHYPYYEFLFDQGSEPPALLASVTFYRDSAGIEGFEWPQMWLLYSFAGLLVVMPLVLLVMIVRRVLERRRAAPPGFPVRLNPSAS